MDVNKYISGLSDKQHPVDPQQLKEENARLRHELDTRQSELTHLFEAIDVPLLTLDQHASIRRANAAARRILAGSDPDLKGQSPEHYFPEEDLPEFREAFQRSQTEQTYVAMQTQLNVRAAIRHHVRLEIDPIIREGQARGARILLRDIESEYQYLRQLQKSRDRYQHLVESVRDIIYRANPAGYFTYVNPAAAVITGYPVAELVGMNYFEIIREDYKERVRDFYREQMARKKKNSYLEMPIVRADGQEIWVGQQVSLVIEAGEVVEATAVSRDITDRKMAEEELRRAKEMAEESQLTERKFLTQMSHEIRTPMNAILGMTHLLYDSSLSEDQREYLDSIHYSADLLSSLFSKLLDLSSIQTGQMVLVEEVFELHRLVRGICRLIQYKIGERPVKVLCEIDPEVPLRVMGAKMALNQILVSLLSNAEKFTAAGTIAVRVTVSAREGSNLRARFEVRDTGTGMAPQQRSSIFNEFRKSAGTPHADYGGTGLGLSIARELVALQQGDIWIDSDAGEGLAFYFEIPLLESKSENDAETGQGAMGELAGHWEDKQLLIVEDNRFNQTYLSDLLTRWRVPHDLAEDGLEALDRSAETTYDLILMDIQMPRMDGHEASTQLRSMTDNPNAHVPIIALSAGDMNEEKGKAIVAGMNDYLTKPFTPIQLHQKLQLWLGIAENTPIRASEGPNFEPAPELDAHLLQELYGGDVAYMWEMFNIFVEEMPIHLVELHHLYEVGDLEKLASLSHKVKPTFAMVGYPRPGETLATITEFARSESPLALPSLKPLLDGLAADTAMVLEIVRAELGRLRANLDQQGS